VHEPLHLNYSVSGSWVTPSSLPLTLGSGRPSQVAHASCQAAAIVDE